MIKGIGVDISDIARFEAKITEERFVAKVFTPQEIQYFSKKTKSAESAAAFFSAKEAFVKALGVGIFSAPLNEIEVVHVASGAPVLKLHGKAAELAAGLQLYLSISHSDGSAVAVVIAEG